MFAETFIIPKQMQEAKKPKRAAKKKAGAAKGATARRSRSKSARAGSR